MKTLQTYITAALLMVLCSCAEAQDPVAEPAEVPLEPSPDGAVTYIISPADGAEVTSPVTVLFGLKGMGVAPAGVEVANTGHHHLLVDVEQLPDLSEPIPSDERHLHFGGGQTQHDLELGPGEHSLQLVFADRLHRPHDPPVVSEKITIIVK